MTKSTDRQTATMATFLAANWVADDIRRFSVCRSNASSTSGGRSRRGYIDRYEAKERATMALKGAPRTALAMAKRIAQLVKTLVVRPMQLAIVNGLKRKLERRVSTSRNILSHQVRSYEAATTRSPVFFHRRGDVKSRDCPASPVDAICVKASALSKSAAVYTKAVKIGHAFTSGSSEKSGSNRGAWW